MLSDSNKGANEDVYVYLLNGVASTQRFLEGMRAAVHGKLSEAGVNVHSIVLFPYGEQSRSVLAQLREVRHDMQRGFRRPDQAVGARRVVEAIRELKPSEGSRAVLIGHSGGGVAAVHTAKLLLERKTATACPVVMIGSPRCRIPADQRGSVFYTYSAGRTPRNRDWTADFICRLGSFGGWTANRFRVPAWQIDKHAPGAASALPIIGGHADYFRDHEPYVNGKGQSNLDITLGAIWPWVKEQLAL